MKRLLSTPFARGFLGALAGSMLVTAAVLLLHFYLDHQSLHALIGIENQRQEQAKGSAS